jgi:hypothetical protein
MSTINTPTPTTSYPATLNIDYPDRKLNRLTSFFRIFMIIPIAIVISLLANADPDWGEHSKQGWAMVSAGGLVFLPLVLMILFRQKYPKWWFDWNLALTRFCYRVSCYLLLLRDEYPSTDEEQAVHLELVYPDAKTQIGRGWPLIKWFLAIPHYCVLFFLFIGVIVCSIIAWFAILFTGRYPKGIFEYIVGVERWSLRVEAYAFLLVTDKYPPFSIQA